jgi:hypothetical protein
VTTEGGDLMTLALTAGFCVGLSGRTGPKARTTRGLPRGLLAAVAVYFRKEYIEYRNEAATGKKGTAAPGRTVGFLRQDREIQEMGRTKLGHISHLTRRGTRERQ